MAQAEVRTVCVLGTGNMGPGIAVLFGLAGHKVFLWAHSTAGIEKGARDAARNRHLFSVALQYCRRPCWQFAHRFLE